MRSAGGGSLSLLAAPYGGVLPSAAAFVPPPATRWSFRLFLAFLAMLYFNVGLLVPALRPFAPTQSVAIAALLVMLLERAAFRQPFRLVWPESQLLIAFVGVALVSSFVGLWPRYALENTLSLAKFVAIYLLIANTVESWPRLRTGLAWMALWGAAPAVGALYNWRSARLVEGRVAWIGIFDNPNDLAYALTVVFPIALALSLGARGWRRLPFVAAMALMVAAIFLSYSRSGMVAFAVVLVLCVFRFAPSWWRLPVVALLAAGLAVAVTTRWQRSEGFTTLAADTTLHERLSTFRVGLRMFADRPLLGAGPGCSEVGWPAYVDPSESGGRWLHSHNVFVQALSETGLTGFVVFGLAIGAGLVKSHRLARDWRRRGRSERARLAAALHIALWGFLACGLAGGHLLTWFPYLLLGFVSAAAAIPLDSPSCAASRAS